MKSSDIYGRMTVQYRNLCKSPRNVYEWVERFKGVQTSVLDDTRYVRHLILTRVMVKERIDQCIRDNRIGIGYI